MHLAVNPIATQLMFGIHDEWNVRELRVQQLFSGQSLVSWVFKDDGPIRDGRLRHADIPVSFVVSAQFDWLAWKTQLWVWLEKIKREVRTDTNPTIPRKGVKKTVWRFRNQAGCWWFFS